MEPAYVLSVVADRVSVIVPRFGMEGTLLLQDIVSDNFMGDLGGALLEDIVEYDASSHSVTVMDTSKKVCPATCHDS